MISRILYNIPEENNIIDNTSAIKRLSKINRFLIKSEFDSDLIYFISDLIHNFKINGINAQINELIKASIKTIQEFKKIESENFEYHEKLNKKLEITVNSKEHYLNLINDNIHDTCIMRQKTEDILKNIWEKNFCFKI